MAAKLLGAKPNFGSCMESCSEWQSQVLAYNYKHNFVCFPEELSPGAQKGVILCERKMYVTLTLMIL